MRIGGVQETSLLDYPDRLSTIIWVSGCNFRCPFCYNKSLVFGGGLTFPEEELLSSLAKRKKLLEAVVISGGEPLLQDDVSRFLKKVRDLGYLIKVDTNGTSPENLKELLDLQLVDYVAMDVKAPKDKYQQLTGVTVDLTKIEESMYLIKKKAPSYEFRTTFVPTLLEKEDIIQIAHWLKGADLYYLQQFKIMTPLLSSELETVEPYPLEYLQETLKDIRPYFKQCFIRGV